MSGESGKLLKRLKYNCHMCKKHCRDADAFKCHKQSQSHQRNMLEFMQNPDQFIDQFSQEFKEEFLRLLSHRWPHSWVLAVKVHHCTLSSRKQVHLNATMWEALSDFIQHCHQEELLQVQDSEEGLLVKWIDPTPRIPVMKKPAKKSSSDLAKEISKLGAKTTTQAEGASALQPHEELSLELKSFEPKLLRAGVFSAEETELPPQHKKSNLDTVLKDEGFKLDLRGAVFKVKSGPAESLKGVVLRAERNSYLLRLLKTGETLRESIDNLESVVPVGST
jgi:DNA/RNA-binding protein KIN17